MKFLFLSLAVALNLAAFAQKPCDFSTNVTDSLGTYKSTKEYLVYEKDFAGNSTYVFNSFIISDGTPMLNVQLIEKSSDFIKARCFDKNSKLYVQLNNGKIVTLLHIDKDDCGTLINEKGLNNRILSGYFMFRKEDFQELKNSPVSFVRLKFGAETEDYIYRKAFKSEMNGEVYEPENYFINYFHCLEDRN